MERAHLLRAKRCMLLFCRLASFFIMQFCSYSYSIILIFFIFFSFFLSFRFAGCSHLDVDGWRAVERRDRRRLHAQGSVPDEPIGYWCSGIHRYRCLHLQVEIDSFLMKRRHISSVCLFFFCLWQFAAELFASPKVRPRFHELLGRLVDGPQRCQLHHPLQQLRPPQLIIN